MGHSSIVVTMEVYNHITEQARIEKEILKMGYEWGIGAKNTTF